MKGPDLSPPLGVIYLANNYAWMNSEIVSDVLKRLDHKMKMQNRNVLLLDNTTTHQASIDIKPVKRKVGVSS